MAALALWYLAVASLLGVTAGAPQLPHDPEAEHAPTTQPPVTHIIMDAEDPSNHRNNKMDSAAFYVANVNFVDGVELLEKDMMLTPEQWQAFRERKAIADLRARWDEGPDGYPYVPYIFVDEGSRTKIEEAINSWMEHTCIKFEETTDEDQPHLRFINGTGCWSYIGELWNRNGQEVSIGTGCENFGTIVHELGHSLGFFHEQSRPDRDTYVTILLDNVITGKEHNFQIQSTALDYGVPYDYTSIMHYGST
ncbi:Blastula protease 10-like 6, partial [Homarus americanus]